MRDLIEYLSTRAPRFQPVPYVNADANLITWHWKNAPAVTESIMHGDKWVGSVHRDLETDEVVGVSLHIESIAGFEKTTEKPS